jgi:signal transduction histidine kinase
VSGAHGERLGRRAGNRDISDRKRGEEELQKSEMQLRRLSTQLLEVQENERKRIAGDLHDGIGQSLSAIKFGVETVVDRLEKDADPSTVDTLQSLVPMLQDAIEDVRKTVMNLRPSILDDLGVLATISWFVRQFQTVYSEIRVEEQINVQETDIHEALKTNIFRVLQEAANNIAKHSSADRFSVSLTKQNDSLELVIADNGQGFDPDSVLETEDIETGFGITSMKERTELSGGSFSIESVKGIGTTIRSVWPRTP